MHTSFGAAVLVYLYPHSDRWAVDYAQERARILAVFGDKIVLHHIGSTAVAGLHAKDCIDLLGVVEHLADVQGQITAMSKLGYEHRGEYGIEGRAYFSKRQRKAHLHVFARGDQKIQDHLEFVRTLSASPRLVEELNALKSALHSRHPNDRSAYQRGKSAFYERIRAQRANF